MKPTQELIEWLEGKAENLKSEIESFELLAGEYFSEEEWNEDYKIDIRIYNELLLLIEALKTTNK